MAKKSNASIRHRDRRFQKLLKAARIGTKPGRPPIGASGARMVQFAEKVERSLIRNEALPSRRSDRSFIGDLSDLEWRTAVLWQAIHEFVNDRPSRRRSLSFEARLMLLASAVESVYDVCRDTRGPMNRLLKSKCGPEGLALSALTSAEGTLKGLGKSK